MTAEGRRGCALLLLAGGGLAMTLYAGVALWIVRARPTFAFYLGAGALTLIAIVLTGFAGLLVKRSIKASALGGSFEVSDGVAAAAGAVAVAGALSGAAAGAAAASQEEPA